MLKSENYTYIPYGSDQKEEKARQDKLCDVILAPVTPRRSAHCDLNYEPLVIITTICFKSELKKDNTKTFPQYYSLCSGDKIEASHKILINETETKNLQSFSMN